MGFIQQSFSIEENDTFEDNNQMNNTSTPSAPNAYEIISDRPAYNGILISNVEISEFLDTLGEEVNIEIPNTIQNFEALDREIDQILEDTRLEPTTFDGSVQA